jgi:hypothetical protein
MNGKKKNHTSHSREIRQKHLTATESEISLIGDSSVFRMTSLPEFLRCMVLRFSKTKNVITTLQAQRYRFTYYKII